MLERALNITSPKSRLGFIIPSTFLCDKSALKLRKEILLRYKVDGIYDFLERAKIFQDANQAVCIVLLDKSSKGETIPVASNLTDIKELYAARPTMIPLKMIKEIFPDDLAIPKITRDEWAILKKIHQNPSLREVPWIRIYRGEVDLTIYKDCLSKANTGYKLIRGDHITRYRLVWVPSKGENFVSRNSFLKKLGNSEKAEHTNVIRIAGQQVSNMMQRWRLKFCLIQPRNFLANSCNYLIITPNKGEMIDSLRLYILALLNSCLLNWRFKLTSTNNHINNYELGALPIKLINHQDRREAALFNLIIKRVREILQEERTVDIDPQVESAIFHLYKLAPEEVKIILKSEGIDQRSIESIMEYFFYLRGIR